MPDLMHRKGTPLCTRVGNNPITLSDATTYTNIRAVYVGGGGDLSVVLAEDSTETIFRAVPAGTLLPISPKIIRLTNTTATNVVAVK